MNAYQQCYPKRMYSHLVNITRLYNGQWQLMYANSPRAWTNFRVSWLVNVEVEQAEHYYWFED